MYRNPVVISQLLRDGMRHSRSLYNDSKQVNRALPLKKSNWPDQVAVSLEIARNAAAGRQLDSKLPPLDDSRNLCCH